ncbi:MAG: hypothetical protein ACKER6_00530 [Candidatus Hodgkinia cicadicola]
MQLDHERSSFGRRLCEMQSGLSPPRRTLAPNATSASDDGRKHKLWALFATSGPKRSFYCNHLGRPEFLLRQAQISYQWYPSLCTGRGPKTKPVGLQHCDPMQTTITERIRRVVIRSKLEAPSLRLGSEMRFASRAPDLLT